MKSYTVETKNGADSLTVGCGTAREAAELMTKFLTMGGSVGVVEQGPAALATVLAAEDLMIAVKRAEYRAMLVTFAVSLMVVGCLVIVLALL
jgi:hypothetical protein